MITWTAASNRPWLTVTPASGTGSAALSVGVRFDPTLPASGTATGAITITLTGAANSVSPVSVTLSITPSTAAASPSFGSFDSPAGDATMLAGSIALTGWALDNIAVRRFTVTGGASALMASEFRLKAETTEFTGAKATPSLVVSASPLNPVVSAFRRNSAQEYAPLVLTRGFNGSAQVLAGGIGTHTIEIKQGERIELRMPRGYDTAFQQGPRGDARASPTGSTWDAASGTFYWQPAPGFLGPYRLVFSNGTAWTSVRVVVLP